MRIAIPNAAPREGNVVPLINIVFLMLVFFLLAGTIAVRPGFQVTPPAAPSGESAAVPREGIYVSADGRVSVSGAVTSADGLNRALSRYLASREEPSVRIVADRAADATLVLGIGEAATAAGARHVTLVTIRDGTR